MTVSLFPSLRVTLLGLNGELRPIVPDNQARQNLYDTAHFRRMHNSIRTLPEMQTPLEKLALWSTSGLRRLDARRGLGFQISSAISAASRLVEEPERLPRRSNPSRRILAAFRVGLISQGRQNLSLVRAGHQKERIPPFV
jgi:hypothetical protein